MYLAEKVEIYPKNPDYVVVYGNTCITNMMNLKETLLFYYEDLCSSCIFKTRNNKFKLQRIHENLGRKACEALLGFQVFIHFPDVTKQTNLMVIRSFHAGSYFDHLMRISWKHFETWRKSLPVYL